MSTRCTKDKQSRKNMFFKYRKDNRREHQTSKISDDCNALKFD